MTAFAAVLFEMRQWERQYGIACGRVRLTPDLMAAIKSEVVVWPVGDRAEGYLERIPGVPADFLVGPDPENREMLCAFECLADCEPCPSSVQ